MKQQRERKIKRDNMRTMLATRFMAILVSIIGLSIIGLFGFNSVPAVFAATKAENSPTINTVNCGNRADFLKLFFYDGSTVCLANAGTTNQQYYEVEQVSTGNNAGLLQSLRTWNGSEWVEYTRSFGKGQTFFWPESAGPIAVTTIYDQLDTVTLTGGQTLYANQYVYNSGYMLVMQTDGNLVLYDWNMTPLWASNTVGNPGAYLAVQNDGNSVVYNANGTPLWASNTPGNPGTDLTVQDDGNVVISNANGTPLWIPTGKPPSTANSISSNPFAANYSNQCTYYAEERMHEQTRMYMPVYGNAYQWATQASNSGWTVGTTPAVNSVVVFPAGSFGSPVGHVAWVIAVSGNELTVQDYNWKYAGAVVTTHNLPILKDTQFIYSDR